MMSDLSFYRNKKILITGHTGFKGSWLTKILLDAGADVAGYSLMPPTTPNLFDLSGIEKEMRSEIGDIRDLAHLKRVFCEVKPEIVLHLAAQPIVLTSYEEPHYTYETNVMGTVNLLECVKETDSVRSVLNVTTDKVYLNQDTDVAFTEDMPLDGYDPYSNSKSCSELVTHSFKQCFFDPKGLPVSTARAGNVIGGGDFADNRIIPDCIRAMKAGTKIRVRNPYSTRPFQHVLEPLMVYLTIAAAQYSDIRYAGYYNIGPDTCDCVSTGDLVDLFCKYWGEGASWENIAVTDAPHEARFLRLDNSKIKDIFGWKPVWHIERCVEMTCRFGKIWLRGGNIPEEMEQEIREFLEA